MDRLGQSVPESRGGRLGSSLRRVRWRSETRKRKGCLQCPQLPIRKQGTCRFRGHRPIEQSQAHPDRPQPLVQSVSLCPRPSLCVREGHPGCGHLVQKAPPGPRKGLPLWHHERHRAHSQGARAQSACWRARRGCCLLNTCSSPIHPSSPARDKVQRRMVMYARLRPGYEVIKRQRRPQGMEVLFSRRKLGVNGWNPS